MTVLGARAEAHGGRLGASPGSQYGAVFQFTLPPKAASNS
jgi:hypothetical protein